jgi:hypothetical protein
MSIYAPNNTSLIHSGVAAHHFIYSKGIRKAREVHSQPLVHMKQQKVVPRSFVDSWGASTFQFSAYFYDSSRIKLPRVLVNI